MLIIWESPTLIVSNKQSVTSPSEVKINRSFVMTCVLPPLVGWDTINTFNLPHLCAFHI